LGLPGTSPNSDTQMAEGTPSEEISIRIKTMDSKEYQVAMQAKASVNDLKAKIEEVSECKR
jgi:hypothetical protein